MVGSTAIVLVTVLLSTMRWLVGRNQTGLYVVKPQGLVGWLDPSPHLNCFGVAKMPEGIGIHVAVGTRPCWHWVAKPAGAGARDVCPMTWALQDVLESLPSRCVERIGVVDVVLCGGFDGASDSMLAHTSYLRGEGGLIERSRVCVSLGVEPEWRKTVWMHEILHIVAGRFAGDAVLKVFQEERRRCLLDSREGEESGWCGEQRGLISAYAAVSLEEDLAETAVVELGCLMGANCRKERGALSRKIGAVRVMLSEWCPELDRGKSGGR